MNKKATLSIASLLILSLNFASSQWEYVGPCCIDAPVGNLESAGSEDLEFLSDGTPVVSYFHQNGGTTTGKVKMYDGNDWIMQGPNLPVVGTISALDLEVRDDQLYVAALTGGSTITIYNLFNNDWQQMGQPFTMSPAFDFIPDNDGNLYVFTSTNQKIWEYNGFDWTEVLTLNNQFGPSWNRDNTIVCDSDNNFFYNHSNLDPNTLEWSTSVMMFDGTNVTQTGDLLYEGGGSNHALHIDNDGNLYSQYIIDSKNHISKLVGNSWEQQLDLSNATNGILSFNYEFDESNTMILSLFSNIYYASDYSPFPAITSDNILISVNQLVQSPNGELYASIGELAIGSGGDFSVLKYNDGNSVTEEKNQGFRIYPNPCSTSFKIENSGTIDSINIYDLQGKLCFKSTTSINENTISLTNDLPSGIYIIELLGNGKISREKLVVNK